MHEWALAESIISASLEIADKEQFKKITEVKIKLGELQQIEKSILNFALSQLTPSQLTKTKFTIESLSAKFACRICNSTWFFNAGKLNLDKSEAIHFVPELVHTYVTCPNCNSPDFSILQGRGVWLDQVIGEK